MAIGLRFVIFYRRIKNKEPNLFIDTAEVQSLGKAYSEVGAIRSNPW